MSKFSQRKKREEEKKKSNQPFNISEDELLLDMLTDNVNWSNISSHKLSVEFIQEYKDHLDWGLISRDRSIPNVYLNSFPDKLNWRLVCMFNTSANFIKKYDQYVDWKTVANYGYITNEIFEKYFEEFYLNLALHDIFENRNSSITCDVIEKYVDYFDDRCWETVGKCPRLSEQFIHKYQSKLNWKDVCYYNQLFETFILEHRDRIKWNYIKTEYYKQWSTQFITTHILPNVTDANVLLGLLRWRTIDESCLNSITNKSLWCDLSYYGDLSEQCWIKNVKKLYLRGIDLNDNINERVRKRIKELFSK